MPAFTTIIQQVVMVIRYSFHYFVLQWLFSLISACFVSCNSNNRAV